MRWMCPVCGEDLTLGEKSASCGNNHLFDRAKQGYYNLLLANQKRSANPGDDRQMIEARQRFLQAGHYLHLAQALAQVVMDCVDERSSLQVLDSGCGEGYYTQYLAEALRLVCPFAQVSGSDISREAIKAAARTYPERTFVIAGNHHLPVKDQSLDVLVRVFTPGSDSEAQRVLKTDGVLVIAAPGAEHLGELKQMLYDDVRPHQPPPTPEGFVLQSEQHCGRQLHLPDQQTVQALLSMTPFAWRGKREGRQQLQECQALTVTTDFFVGTYRRESESA